MQHEKLKSSLRKSNYDDLFSTLERDFINNDLNKLVARKSYSESSRFFAGWEYVGNSELR
jgi:hypothetical protein